jgi:hypothetical protein
MHTPKDKIGHASIKERKQKEQIDYILINLS